MSQLTPTLPTSGETPTATAIALGTTEETSARSFNFATKLQQLQQFADEHKDAINTASNIIQTTAHTIQQVELISSFFSTRTL